MGNDKKDYFLTEYVKLAWQETRKTNRYYIWHLYGIYDIVVHFSCLLFSLFRVINIAIYYLKMLFCYCDIRPIWNVLSFSINWWLLSAF